MQALHVGLDAPSDSETDTDDDLGRPAGPPASQPSTTEADLLQAGGPAHAEPVCGMRSLPSPPLAFSPSVCGVLPRLCNRCKVPTSGVPLLAGLKPRWLLRRRHAAAVCAQAAFCVAGKPAITAQALHKAAMSGRWGSAAMRGNAEAHVQTLLGCAK